jgi:hypothetical protein
MMVNIVNVRTDEIRDYPVNMVNVVNMMNVKMVKIRISRDSLSNERRGVFMAANKIGDRNHRVHIGSHRVGHSKPAKRFLELEDHNFRRLIWTEKAVVCQACFFCSLILVRRFALSQAAQIASHVHSHVQHVQIVPG